MGPPALVRHMLSDALAAAARHDHGRSVPHVDWDRIGRARRAALRRGRDRPRRTSGVGGGSGARPGNDGRASATRRSPHRRSRRARPDPPTTGRPVAPGPPPGATDSGGGAVTGEAERLAGSREPVTAHRRLSSTWGARHGTDGARRRRGRARDGTGDPGDRAVGSVTTLDRPAPRRGDGRRTR